jgi:hypothetical protein
MSFPSIKSLLSSVLISATAHELQQTAVLGFLEWRTDRTPAVKAIVARGQPLSDDSRLSDEDCVICLGFGIEPLASLPRSSALHPDSPSDLGGLGPLEAFCLSSENHVAHRKCILRWWAERQKSREAENPVVAMASLPLRLSTGAQIHAEIRREAPFAWRLQLVRGAKASPWGIGRVDNVTLVPALRRSPSPPPPPPAAAAAEEDAQQVRLELLSAFYHHRPRAPWYSDFTAAEASRLIRLFGSGKAIGTVAGPSCPVCRGAIALELAVARPASEQGNKSPRSTGWVVHLVRLLRYWSKTLGPPDLLGKFTMHAIAAVLLHLGTKARIQL